MSRPSRVARTQGGPQLEGSTEPVAERSAPGREPTKQHFLRHFAATSFDQQPAYVREWGPLVLPPSRPQDVRYRSCGSEEHFRDVFESLSPFLKLQAEGGGDVLIGGRTTRIRLAGYRALTQIATFEVYQAAICTLIDLFLSPVPALNPKAGFSLGDLQSSAPARIRSIWEERTLSSPKTLGDAVDTTFELLLWAASPSAPHLEIVDQEAGKPVYWHVDRGILGAICLQAVSAVADGAVARSCENCGSLFLRRDGDAVERHTDRQGRKYCTKRCVLTAAQRAYRTRTRRRLNAGGGY